MILTVKYFGMIAEALDKQEEEVNFTMLTCNDLQSLLMDQNSQLHNFNFKIAVNHKVVDLNHELKDNDEVALLPPFAGG